MRSEDQDEPSDAEINHPKLTWLGYWVLVSAIIAAFLALWLAHFSEVYGLMGDDFDSLIVGARAVDDWHYLFHGWNVQHWQYLLVDSLPLSTGISLPSYPTPGPGLDTFVGRLRLVALYMLFWHTAILGSWGWLAIRFTPCRRTALISLLLLATSPTLFLWAPKPDSRLTGLPFVLLGVWLLGRASQLRLAPQHILPLVFAAGSLFGFAFSLYQTCSYLIAGVSCVYGILWLWRGRWERLWWIVLVVYAIGGLWQHLVVEAISYFVVGNPVEFGPTAQLLFLRDFHVMEWGRSQSFAFWTTWFIEQMGVPLLLMAGLGIGFYIQRWSTDEACDRVQRVRLASSVIIGLAYLIFISNTLPVFRHTSYFHPLLYLFMAVAIVRLADRVGRSPLSRAVVLTALVMMVGVLPWRETAGVFEGHLGLGRALAWANAHREERVLEWMGFPAYEPLMSLRTMPDLEPTVDRAWAISYFPLWPVRGNPAIRIPLESTPVMAAWPTLAATKALRAETMIWFGHDFAEDPSLSEVRLIDIEQLRKVRRGQPLLVQSITADSWRDPDHEPVNVFDGGRSPDGVTSWESSPTALPHHLEITFQEPAQLGAIQIVPNQRTKALDKTLPVQIQRIGALEIQVRSGGSAFHTVWLGQGLERKQLIQAQWPTEWVDALKVILRGSAVLGDEGSVSVIEEVAFPGYQVVAPPPHRAFQSLELRSVRRTATGLIAEVEQATPDTILVVDGVRLASRRTGAPDVLLADLPIALQGPGPWEVLATDGLRTSNPLAVTFGPPSLLKVEPMSMPPLPSSTVDGTAGLLTLTVDQAAEDMVAVFSGWDVPATRLDAEHIAVQVPVAWLTVVGRHEVWVKNAFGESNRLIFVVARE